MNIEPLYPTNKDGDEESSIMSSPSRANAFLKILLVVLWYVGWIFLIGFICVSLYAALGVMGISSVQSSFEVTTPFMALISSSSMVVGAAVFLIIIKQLRQICHTLVTGDPFVPANADRLRIIWVAVASAEILRLISTFLISWIARGSDTHQQWEPDLRVYVWFMVLALIILSEVFREGARLRLEQKLTV